MANDRFQKHFNKLKLVISFMEYLLFLKNTSLPCEEKFNYADSEEGIIKDQV